MAHPVHLALTLGLLCPLGHADIVWTGAVSDDIFDEANWDLSNSTVTAVDPDVSIDDDVRIPATAVSPVIADLPGQMRFQIGDGFTLTVDGGRIEALGNDGIGGAPGTVNGPTVEVQGGGEVITFFITHDTDMRLDGTSSATFGGPATPINGSRLDLVGNALAHFTDETVQAYTTEHLSKTTVAGAPAVIGVNLMVVSDGGLGCFVTVIGAPLGTPYCSPAANNSGGIPGRIEAEGSALVSDNDVTLTALDLTPNLFAFFINSQAQGFVPMPGGSQGNLCLSGAIGRYNPAAGFPVAGTGASGSISLTLDLTNTPTPGGPTAVAAGQTWNFQCWYRDLNPGAVSNFTDAVSVTFQ